MEKIMPNNKEILLIDDDEIFTRMMFYKLERLFKNRLKVIVANSEEETWKYVEKKEKFCLFLIDIELIKNTGLTQGFDLAESLKKDSRTKDIPIIFITGKFTNLKDERLGRLGVGFLQKPIDSKQLAKKIQEELSKQTT